MVLPAPCHNGWAKGSGWVHAGSSVGNLSEQSVATRRVKKMFNKFSTKIMCRTLSKSQVQHFFLASNHLGGELLYITDLCLYQVISHSHFFSFPLWIRIKSVLNNMSLRSTKTLSKCSIVIRELSALCRLTLPPVFTKTLTVPSCFSCFSYLTSAAK